MITCPNRNELGFYWLILFIICIYLEFLNINVDVNKLCFADETVIILQENNIYKL